MSEATATMSLSKELEDIFDQFDTPSCLTDKEQGGQDILFPELENSPPRTQVSILKTPTPKPSKVIQLNLQDLSGDDEIIGYLQDAISGGHVSPDNSDTGSEHLSSASASTYHSQQVDNDAINNSGYQGEDASDFNYSVDFKKPLGNLSMSKNAIAARENRLKKKNYVQNLEKSVKDLSRENSQLKKNVGSLENSVESLQTEVEYLKSVLANQGALGALLQNIASTQGVKFQAPEFKAISNSVANSPSKAAGKRKRVPGASDNHSDSQKENDHAVNGVTTRIGSTRKIQKLDHDYAAADAKKSVPINGYDAESDTDSEAESEKGAGVCLHVSNKKVSLEFCANCSKKAATPTPGRRRKSSRR